MKRHFIDTNILLYSISDDPREHEKRSRADEILTQRNGVISVQVLQEFYVQATRSTRPAPLTHFAATELIESWLRFSVLDQNLKVLQLALDIKPRYSISYWDAAILAAAKLSGCYKVYSEDMGHGCRIEGVQIENPFL